MKGREKLHVNLRYRDILSQRRLELSGLRLLLSDLLTQDRVRRLCPRVLQGREPQHAALRGLLLPARRDGDRRHELLSVSHTSRYSIGPYSDIYRLKEEVLIKMTSLKNRFERLSSKIHSRFSLH